MKRIVLITCFLLLFCIVLFADDDDKQKYILTAFKGEMASENPKLSVDFRLIDSRANSVTSNMPINIPQEFRQTEYEAFSWVLTGNAYGQVLLSFNFGPMRNEVVSEGQENLTRNISYKVKLYHESTRIGNATIASYSRTLNETERNNLRQGSSINFSYGGVSYDLYYADYYSASGEVTIGSSGSVTTSISYSFATNTVSDGFPPSQTVNVCNYWNRYGKAIVYLDLPSSANGYASGMYNADVVLTVTPTS